MRDGSHISTLRKEGSERSLFVRREVTSVAIQSDARIVVANEPRAYREVIGSAIGRLRPGIEVTLVEPDELNRAVDRLDPQLVVCSRLEERPGSGTWVTCYPDGQPIGWLVSEGVCQPLPAVDLPTILAIVDEIIPSND